jgi:hypothetical protein
MTFFSNPIFALVVAGISLFIAAATTAVRLNLVRRWRSLRLVALLLEWQERSERPRPEHVRLAHSLLAIAVRLLPPSERDRYLEEFHAELLDVPRDTRLRHTLTLLRGVLVVRLRRGLKKKAADAAARAKG